MNRSNFLRLLPWAGAAGWAAAAPANRSRPAPAQFVVRDYGAAGDGRSLDTKPVQAAIDAAAAAGGGRVLLHSGTFLCGALRLKSNVTLQIESGATLLGSPRIDDYPDQPAAWPSRSSELYTRRSLIFAERCENIAIVGGGVLDGQGSSPEFRRPGKMTEADRPLLLRFSECRNVRLRDVSLRNSAMWVQSYLACDNVLLDGITVDSRANHNNDAIDIDDCANVRVLNCDLSSGDDAICLKSTSRRGCRNVVVANCTITTLCSAFKLGTDSTGGFENITLSNCAIYDTRLAGIALEAVDGGTLERITISNIVMKDVGCALFLRIGNRGRGMAEPKPGRLRRITISGIEATGAGDIGSSITGQPGFPVEDVLIENVRILSAGGGTAAQATREVPECAECYPEFNMFVPAGGGPGPKPAQLPAYGLYVRHAAGLALRDVQLSARQPDARPALLVDDAADVRISALHAAGVRESSPVICLRDVSGALIQSCRAPRGAKPFLRVDGARSANIELAANDLSLAAQPIERGDSVADNVVRLGDRLER